MSFSFAELIEESGPGLILSSEEAGPESPRSTGSITFGDLLNEFEPPPPPPERPAPTWLQRIGGLFSSEEQETTPAKRVPVQPGGRPSTPGATPFERAKNKFGIKLPGGGETEAEVAKRLLGK